MARHPCSHGCGLPAFGSYATCCTHCIGPDGPHAGDCEAKAERGATAVIRVVGATLWQSFVKFGRMDPFAIADYVQAGGEKVRIGCTSAARGAHLEPLWHFTCRQVKYSGAGSGDELRLQVLEGHWGGLASPKNCGEAIVMVEQLLEGAHLSAGLKQGQSQELPLMKKGQQTGVITVQLFLHLTGGRGFQRGLGSVDLSVPAVANAGCLTSVDPSLFQLPAKRFGVSGGTAPFFELRLNDVAEQSQSYWIGKDLSHAMDEVGFYEQRRVLAAAGSQGLEHLFQFMFEYLGVLECNEEGFEQGPPRQLLVLRNLGDGCLKLRLLDIKIGEKTAAAGWQGKTRIAALRQSLVDGFTNSYVEGFRLEGFDGQPPALKSMDPLLDLGGSEDFSEKLRRKAMRLMLQRMPATDFLMHFLDLRQAPAFATSALATELSAIEVAELVLHEVTVKLTALAVACRRAPAPQKWIGSSVALGFDAGRAPSRCTPESQLRSRVLVKIFDWGRSELNALERHTTLSAQEQGDRLEYWRYYAGGIDRLCWEAAREYWHRFTNVRGWHQALLTVFDFDSVGHNDYIGQVQVPMAIMQETTSPLMNRYGKAVHGRDGPATITYSVSWIDFPGGARLKGTWRIHVLRASNLVGLDGLRGQSSDPFVSVTVSSEDGLLRWRQDSAMAPKTLHPVWDETFDVPAAKPSEFPHELLQQAADIVAAEDLFPVSASQEETAGLEALTLWRKCLDQSVGRISVKW
mmetsp:Transcript_25988/g.57349  ORF Transcript_25988/g.57349 Transcript_25988/m.57349 type:complete len:743 (-) Transcript_25988:89-2317(-)